MTRLARFSAALVATGLFAAAPALAASGPTSVAPAQHATVAVGSQPTFTVRDHSSKAKHYGIFVTVASRYVVKRGELQKDDGPSGTFSRMDRRPNDLYSFTPELFTYPDYFLQRPGKYWWQAFHIDCTGLKGNCHIVGRIRSFTVG